MQTLTESGITITLPDNNGFRFEGQAAYQQLNHISEMDIGWYDVDNDVLYFIELKDWQDATLAEDTDPNYDTTKLQALREKIRKNKVQNLLNKSVSVAAMVSSILLDRSAGKRLLRDLSQQATGLAVMKRGHLERCISNATKWRFYHIANWQDTNATYLSNLNDTYRRKFKSYADLFQIRPYQLITKNQAILLSKKGIFPFVVS